MRTIGNILWFILAGWWLALLYVVAGVIACILIITIPFGLASFRLASFVLWPFGRTTVWRQDAGFWSVVGNILWILLLGWELAIGHLIAGPALSDHHRHPVWHCLLEDGAARTAPARSAGRARLAGSVRPVRGARHPLRLRQFGPTFLHD